ncbi:hypothetical protein MMC07_002595 [Pseudocyphellaria aurata]|nr:hypothetical protein [Pseudocyphellaria aurata]
MLRGGAGDENFMQDVRSQKGLDGLGCLVSLCATKCKLVLRQHSTVMQYQCSMPPPEVRLLEHCLPSLAAQAGRECWQGDIGWYCLSNTLWAFNHDPPSLVQAQPADSSEPSPSGAKYNANGVFTHVAATLVWDDGRRAMIDCGFDRFKAGARIVQLLSNVRSMCMQVTCTKGLLQWQDFCIPNEEDSCEFTLKGSGSMVDLDTHIEQTVEQKKRKSASNLRNCAADPAIAL